MINNMRALFYIFCAFFAFGCAFFQGSRYAEALITSNVDGALIYKIYTRHMASGKIEDEHTKLLGQTPMIIEVPKDAQIMIVLVKQGYKNKEFIIRTGFKTIYMDDGKYYRGCSDEDQYAWATGGIYSNAMGLLAPDVKEQYCSSDRYQYNIDLEKA